MGTSLQPLILKETSAPGTPPSGHVVLYSVDGSVLLVKDDAGVVRTVDGNCEHATFHHAGTLTTGTGVFRVPIHGGSFVIVSVDAMINTQPTGASVIVDINKNGTTIFGTQGNRPTIAVSTNDATVGAFSVSSLAAGDYLTCDIDQIGSTVAGANLVVDVRYMRVA